MDMFSVTQPHPRRTYLQRVPSSASPSYKRKASKGVVKIVVAINKCNTMDRTFGMHVPWDKFVFCIDLSWSFMILARMITFGTGKSSVQYIIAYVQLFWISVQLRAKLILLIYVFAPHSGNS